MEQVFFDRCVQAIARSDMLKEEDVDLFDTVEKARDTQVRDDLGINSTQLLDILFEIEEEFDITVPINGYDESMSVYELIEMAYKPYLTEAA